MLPNVKREMEMDEDNKCEVKRIKQEQVEMTPGPWSTEMANLEIDGKKPIVKAEDTASDRQLAEGEAINGNPYTVDGSERSVERSDESDEEDQEGGGPSTRLRKRTAEPTKERKADKPQGKKQANNGKKNVKAGPTVKRPVGQNEARMEKFEEAEYKCDLEGCTMSFGSKQEPTLHKKDVCPVKGCGKMFSRKYLVQHRRVHLEDRPLKCPQKGCEMTFKWASARTEHIRVHTGDHPYICDELGCEKKFRFVSNSSRHKRKTGHSVRRTKESS